MGVLHLHNPIVPTNKTFSSKCIFHSYPSIGIQLAYARRVAWTCDYSLFQILAITFLDFFH